MPAEPCDPDDRIADLSAQLTELRRRLDDEEARAEAFLRETAVSITRGETAEAKFLIDYARTMRVTGIKLRAEIAAIAAEILRLGSA